MTSKHLVDPELAAILDYIPDTVLTAENGNCHVSGASMTPSKDINSDTTIFLIRLAPLGEGI